MPSANTWPSVGAVIVTVGVTVKLSINLKWSIEISSSPASKFAKVTLRSATVPVTPKSTLNVWKALDKGVLSATPSKSVSKPGSVLVPPWEANWRILV